MAAVNIYWGDGTSDVITVNYTGNVGSSQMTVASSPNVLLAARSKTITLKSAAGDLLASLTVTQQPRDREYGADYNNDYK
jgi:hypothetical protein